MRKLHIIEEITGRRVTFFFKGINATNERRYVVRKSTLEI
jgi:hypothetical protein